LGNIAGDSPKARDYVIQCGILKPLLQILNSSSSKITLIRNAAWCFSNLCRGKPQPKLEEIAEGLPIMARLLQTSDTELLTDVLWAFSYVSDGNDANIQAVLQTGAAPRLIELLSNPSYTIQTPALRAVGNIVTGNDSQTQVMLDLGLLAPLYKLLQSQRKAIRKEAAWTISNITAGNASQTQMVINASIFPLLAGLLNSGEFDVKKEVMYAITNATTWKVAKQIRHIVDSGCVRPMIELFTAPDPKIVMVALDGIENILLVGAKVSKDGTNPYAPIVEENEGIDRLEELQSHENNDVYQRAVKLLESYFQASEDQNMMPNAPMVSQSNNQFAFGSNLAVPSGGFVF
jgi:importin subunit alpha-1